MSGSADDAPPAVLRCTHCGSEIECCEVCDREDCAAASCYECMLARLDASPVGPHEHGR